MGRTDPAIKIVPAAPEGGFCQPTWLAAAGLIVPLLVVALFKPWLAAVTVVLPAIFRIRLVNVATPFTAATVVVDPLAKGAMLAVTVTLAVLVLTKLPY